MVMNMLILLGVIVPILANSTESEIPDATFPWTISFVYFLVFITTALSNAAGIGGGPIFICIFLNIMSSDNLAAIASTQVCILGGSTIAMILKMTFKHPKDPNIPLINYNLIAHLCGCLVLGASLGTLVTRVSQQWTSLSALIVIVWIISYLTLTKGINLYKNESKDKSTLVELAVALTTKEHEPESNVFAICAILFSLAELILFNMLKGDHNFSSVIGVVQCTSEYFAIIIGYFILISAQTCGTGYYFMKKQERNNKNCDKFGFDKKSAFVLPIFVFFTGILSGALGIGGGLVLNPIFILYGLNPQVSTACCNVFVFFSSFSSFFSLYLAGIVDLEQSLIYFSIGSAGSIIGIFGLDHLVKRFNRSSLIVLLLGGVLLLVGIVLPINLGRIIYQEINDGTFTFQFKSIC